MHVSRVIIKNFRNLKDVDVPVGNVVTIVGENNSGKSNFLKAVALPLSSEDGESKRLSWYDINKEERDQYYAFIKNNVEQIKNGTVEPADFAEHLPEVSITLYIEAGEKEHWDVSRILYDDGKNFIGAMQYRFFVENPSILLQSVQAMLNSDEAGKGDDYQKSLLPMSAFTTDITVPGKGKVPYDIRSKFKTVVLPAERDTFSVNMDRIGSRALIDILQNKLLPQSQMKIEKVYTQFFDTVKAEAGLEEILNWQDYSEIPNAKEFFDEISVMPNMPQIGSILGNIKLGYDEEPMFIQGLGHRNMVLMMILLNSYLNSPHDISLRTVTVEEPEAHLSTNNILLLASFFRKFSEKNKYTQLFFSTHSTEFVNKMGIENILFATNGNVISLKSSLEPEQMDYIAANPNTDIFKLFYSRRVILVEGITEELLIKSYLQTKPNLNDIKVLSFHKGYKKIVDIWKILNDGNGRKLGVVRDYDDQPNAQREHERLQNAQVIAVTTREKTLEPEILSAGDNLSLLKERYGAEYGWEELDKDAIAKSWEKMKSDVMLRICHDLLNDELEGFTMPQHIHQVLSFMIDTSVDELSGTAGTAEVTHAD